MGPRDSVGQFSVSEITQENKSLGSGERCRDGKRGVRPGPSSVLESESV